MLTEFATKRVVNRKATALTSVKVHGEQGTFFCYMRDISCLGMSTFCLKSLATDRKYNVEFSIPEIGELIRCKASVRWNWPHTQCFVSVCRQGLMFEDMDPDMVRRLDEWVNGRSPRMAA